MPANTVEETVTSLLIGKLVYKTVCLVLLSFPSVLFFVSVGGRHVSPSVDEKAIHGADEEKNAENGVDDATGAAFASSLGIRFSAAAFSLQFLNRIG